LARQPRSVAGRLVTHREYRQPSSVSNRASCAGVRALAAGKDPHRLGPAGDLVAGRPFAEQAGQLGDVRFLDPAAAVRAVPITAGVAGSALADLAALIDGDLPGSLGHQLDRAAFPLAQLPADRVGQLIVGFQNSATGPGLVFYAARSYSLMRPPRTGRRSIRFRDRSATG
jgi:hypothetical protein